MSNQNNFFAEITGDNINKFRYHDGNIDYLYDFSVDFDGRFYLKLEKSRLYFSDIASFRFDGNIFVVEIKYIDNERSNTFEVHFKNSESNIHILSYMLENLICTLSLIPLYDEENGVYFSGTACSTLIKSDLPKPKHLLLTCDDTYNYLPKIIEFYFEWLRYLYEIGLYPSENNNISASYAVVHKVLVLDNINKEISSLQDTDCSDIDIPEDGEFDIEEYNEKMFFSMNTRDHVEKFLPYLTGFYPRKSTKEQRKQIDEKHDRLFEELKTFLKVIEDKMPTTSNEIRNAFKVIGNDVHRTNKEIFKDSNCLALTLVSTVLKLYCIYNTKVLYIQGMSDICVPFIFAYSNVGDNGDLSSKNNQPLDEDRLFRNIFWSFYHFLDASYMTLYFEHFPKMTTEIIAELKEKLLELFPSCGFFFKVNKIEHIWVHQEYSLLFKRKFKNIWDLWISILTAPNRKTFVRDFMIAILIELFEHFVKTERPPVNDGFIITQIEENSHKLKIDRLKKIAYIINKKSINEASFTPKVEMNSPESKFFKC